MLDRPSRWFLRPPSGDHPARLFCLPYSGCGASMFRAWPESVGPAEVCPVQLPARENRIREPHYQTYEALAVELAEAVAPFLDRPYAFIGHCGGVLPGLETALRLVELGRRAPAHLFVSSQVAPHDGPYGRFLQLPRSGLQNEVRGLLRELNAGVAPREEIVDYHLDVLVEDVEANKRYRREPPVRLPCPITVVGWTADREVAHDLMGGWSAWSADVRFRLLDGEHYTFLAPTPAFFDVVREAMEEAVAAEPPAPAPSSGNPRATPRAGAPVLSRRASRSSAPRS